MCVYVIRTSKANISPKELVKKTEIPEGLDEQMKQEANLLAVAMTRVRHFAWVSYEKEPCPSIERISSRSGG